MRKKSAKYFGLCASGLTLLEIQGASRIQYGRDHSALQKYDIHLG